MRALITGAEGFAGSHLVEHCLAQGDEVWGTCRQGARATNIAHLADQMTIRVGDLVKPDRIYSILDEAEFDVIYHLAGITFVPDAERGPATAYEINVLAGIHLLEALRTRQPKAKVVLASSAEVYGHVPADQMPIHETARFAPVNIFASGKAALELATFPFVNTYGLNVTIVRPFNHTGPRQRPDFVCSSFAEQVALVEAGMQKEIRVGDLTPKRDFSDVRDIVRGYRQLAEHGEPGEAYNLASGHSVSIQEVLGTLQSMSRVKCEVVPDPVRLRKTQVMDVYGSYKKVHERCGWQPEIPLEKTLRDSLNWHRDVIVQRRKAG